MNQADKKWKFYLLPIKIPCNKKMSLPTNPIYQSAHTSCVNSPHLTFRICVKLSPVVMLPQPVPEHMSHRDKCSTYTQGTVCSSTAQYIYLAQCAVYLSHGYGMFVAQWEILSAAWRDSGFRVRG